MAYRKRSVLVCLGKYTLAGIATFGVIAGCPLWEVL